MQLPVFVSLILLALLALPSVWASNVDRDKAIQHPQEQPPTNPYAADVNPMHQGTYSDHARRNRPASGMVEGFHVVGTHKMIDVKKTKKDYLDKWLEDQGKTSNYMGQSWKKGE